MRIKSLMLGAVGAALAAGSLAAAPAEAQYYGGHGYSQSAGRGWGDSYRGGRGYYEAGYGGRGYDGGHRYHDRCDRGTGGTIIGAIAGGLLGNSVAGYGDRTAGTVIGAGVGALAGRAVDRDC